MADSNTQARALASELSRATYQADDLPNLARNVYVRCLLKVHGIAGRHGSAKSVAIQVTANVLKQLVGFHFTPADVQKLLDEEEEPPVKSEPVKSEKA
jgi:hypothetical protein